MRMSLAAWQSRFFGKRRGTSRRTEQAEKERAVESDWRATIDGVTYTVSAITKSEARSLLKAKVGKLPTGTVVHG